MLWEQQIEYAALSDVGMRRQNNQDSCTVLMELDRETWERCGHVFVVADGMGGHAVGELASKIAVDTLPLTYKKSQETTMQAALRSAMHITNAAIHEKGTMNRDFQRMGTTCSTLVLGPEGALIAHVGDSRIYRVRSGRIDQLTFDHSLQWELLRRGQGTPEDIFLHQPKNVITRSMGPEAQVEVDLEGPYPVMPGDVYVLCSDGLTNHVSDHEIGVVASELPANDAARFLIHLANLRGGTDNITATVVRIGKIPEGAMPSQTRRDAPSGEISGWWLGAAWGVAGFFCLGVILALTGHIVGGLVIAGTAVLLGALALMKWRRTLPPPPVNVNSRSTILWRPYRSESAKISREFLNEMILLHSRVSQTADEEDWNYDRETHKQYSEEGQESLNEKNNRRAFRDFARAIDSLMAGLQKKPAGKKKDSKIFKMPPQATKGF